MWFILSLAIAASLVGEAMACAALPTPLAYKLKLTKMNLAYKYVQAGTNITIWGMGQTPENVKNKMLEDVQDALNDAVEVMCRQHVVDSNQMATVKSQFKLKAPSSYTVVICDYLSHPGAGAGIWKPPGSGNGRFGCVANEQQFVDQMCTVEQVTEVTKACYYGNNTIIALPEPFRNVNFDMDMSNSFFSTASTEQQNNFVKLIKKNLITRSILTDGTGDVTLTK